MKKEIIICLSIIVILLCGCGKKDKITAGSFTVTSSSLNTDGSWNDIITNTSAGQNRSPQLSWKAVNGAAYYAVYMLDTTAGNWLHWKAGGLTNTELSEGSNPGEYLGPYPPSGVHKYTVYVFALKDTPDSLPGGFDSRNKSIETLMDSLNISSGKSGNILAYGSTTGTYTAK